MDISIQYCTVDVRRFYGGSWHLGRVPSLSVELLFASQMSLLTGAADGWGDCCWARPYWDILLTGGWPRCWPPGCCRVIPRFWLPNAACMEKCCAPAAATCCNAVWKIMTIVYTLCSLICNCQMNNPELYTKLIITSFHVHTRSLTCKLVAGCWVCW